MAHSNDHPVAKGQHEYKDGNYQKVEDFTPSDYPKYLYRREGDKKLSALAKDQEHETLLKEQGYSDQAHKED